MSAARVARALNSWTKEGLDMLGGADGAALADLVSEFMAAPGSEDDPQECKTQPFSRFAKIAFYYYNR